MEEAKPLEEMATAPATEPSLPQPIDARAAVLAAQIVEGHYEVATGSHLHWLYRELSKLMHRDFALRAREEAAQQRRAPTHRGHRKRGAEVPC